MITGVDYYPEYWDKSLWKADADLMQQTGVKVVHCLSIDGNEICLEPFEMKITLK